MSGFSVRENPGRSMVVQEGQDIVTVERVSPVEVQVAVSQPGSLAIGSLSNEAGMALLRGLAALYDCRIDELSS